MDLSSKKMDKTTETMVQTSLFFDNNTFVNESCKKIDKTLREKTAKKENLSGKCPYLISGGGFLKCYIAEKQQENFDEISVKPCFASCGTDNCPYFIKKR